MGRGETRGTRGVQRSLDVREDWLSSLPEEQDRLFDSVRNELESAYQISSIALSDALTLSHENRLPPAAEQSAIVGDTVRSCGRLLQTRAARHGRTWPPFRNGIRGHSAPPWILPQSQCAARAAKQPVVLTRALQRRGRFFRKIARSFQIVAALQNETRYLRATRAPEIAESWNQLEEFHYDLNTCLRETMVRFKSFLCVLPGAGMAPFRTAPSLTDAAAGTGSFLDDRRFLATIASEGPQTAARRRLPLPERNYNRYNSRSGLAHPMCTDAVPTGPVARTRPTQSGELTEAEAIRRAQQGDADAFERIYRLHSRRVYALCLRMVGNTAEAEDLTQEAFLQLFRKIGTFRGESAFSTWLHRLAVNVVLMRLRKKTIAATSLDEQSEPDEETSGPKDFGVPDLRLSGSVDRVNLERAVRQLSPGYRSVFVLHDVQGYEHNEIAAIMRCSIGNSKSQLHKARMRLRELLHENERARARDERQAAKSGAAGGH